MGKLIKCKDCGQEISKKAKQCPHCGAPVKKGIGCGTSLVVILLVIGSIVYLSSRSERTSPPSSSSQPTPTAQPSPPPATPIPRLISPVSTSTPSRQITPSPKPGQTLDADIADLAIIVWGATENMRKQPRIIEVTHTERPSIEGPTRYLINIAYRADENLNVKMIRDGIIADARDLIKKLSTSYPVIEEYLLRPHLHMVDKYGNEKEMQIGKIVLRREIATKINWDNITLNGFEQILQTDGQLWIHPALQKD